MDAATAVGIVISCNSIIENIVVYARNIRECYDTPPGCKDLTSDLDCLKKKLDQLVIELELSSQYLLEPKDLQAAPEACQQTCNDVHIALARFQLSLEEKNITKRDRWKAKELEHRNSFATILQDHTSALSLQLDRLQRKKRRVEGLEHHNYNISSGSHADMTCSQSIRRPLKAHAKTEGKERNNSTDQWSWRDLTLKTRASSRRVIPGRGLIGLFVATNVDLWSLIRKNLVDSISRRYLSRLLQRKEPSQYVPSCTATAFAPESSLPAQSSEDPAEIRKNSSEELPYWQRTSRITYHKFCTKLLIAASSLEASCISRNFGRTHKLLDSMDTSILQSLGEDNFGISSFLGTAVHHIMSRARSAGDIENAHHFGSPSFAAEPGVLTLFAAALVTTYSQTWYSELDQEDKYQHLFAVSSLLSVPTVGWVLGLDILASMLVLSPLLGLVGLILSDLSHAVGRRIFSSMKSNLGEVGQM